VIPNPYQETRKQSKGELTQEWASLFNMIASLSGLTFTDTEKRAFVVCIGALVREWQKGIGLLNLVNALTRFIPK
jgi:hypothetical protein